MHALASAALAAATEPVEAQAPLKLNRAQAIRDTVASQSACAVQLNTCPKTPLRNLLPEPDEWLKGTRGQLVVEHKLLGRAAVEGLSSDTNPFGRVVVEGTAETLGDKFRRAFPNDPPP
jgi:hypothetical protein